MLLCTYDTLLLLHLLFLLWWKFNKPFTSLCTPVIDNGVATWKSTNIVFARNWWRIKYYFILLWTHHENCRDGLSTSKPHILLWLVVSLFLLEADRINRNNCSMNEILIYGFYLGIFRNGRLHSNQGFFLTFQKCLLVYSHTKKLCFIRRMKENLPMGKIQMKIQCYSKYTIKF